MQGIEHCDFLNELKLSGKLNFVSSAKYILLELLFNRHIKSSPHLATLFKKFEQKSTHERNEWSSTITILKQCYPCKKYLQGKNLKDIQKRKLV